MAEYILNMVKQADPETIEKYVKNHLPNDQPSLERIYNQLLHYNITPEQNKNFRTTKRSKSVNTLSSKAIHNQLERAAQEQIQKTGDLIRMLKERGLKAAVDGEEQGLQIITKQKERLVKPLLPNSKLLKSQQAVIDRVINRYSINSQFYHDKLLHSQLNKEVDIDPQMKEFFNRRETILSSIKNQNVHITINRKFSSVQPKLLLPTTTRTSFQRQPSLQKTARQELKALPAKNILKICDAQIRKNIVKSVNPNINHFRDLQKKAKLDCQDYSFTEIQDAAVFHKMLTEQQYRRYTNTYMNMMTKKTKAGSKCKLSSYDKDLLRDAQKLRKIVDINV